jgi:uncharacterized protein
LLENNGSLYYGSYEKYFINGSYNKLEDFQNNFIASPYFLKIISKDLTKFSIIIESDTIGKENIRSLAVEEVKKVVDNYKDILPNAIYSGNAILNYEINKTTKSNLFFLLLCIFIIISSLSFFLGGYNNMIIVCGVAILTISTSLFIIHLNSNSITFLSITLLVIVSVIAVSDSFHILETWKSHRLKFSFINDSRFSNVVHLFKIVMFPCFLTSLTSAIGFSTFMITNLVPLFNFGRDASISIIVSYFINMVFIFSMLCILPLGKSLERAHILIVYYNNLTETILRHIVRCVYLYNKKIISIFSFFSILTLFTLPFAKTESNFLDIFFSKSSKFYNDFTYLDTHFKGSNSFNIIIESNIVDNFSTYNGFLDIKNIVDSFLSLSHVNDVESYLMPITIVHKIFSDLSYRSEQYIYPKNTEELSQEILFLELSRDSLEPSILSSYLDFNYKKTHIKVQTNNLDTDDIDILLRDITHVLDDFPQYKSVITGNNAYFNFLSKDIFSTQIYSIVFCILIIFLSLVLFFNYLIALYTVITAVFPVLITFSAIILSSTSFDFAIIIVASLSIGLSIDNSLHILNYYINHRNDAFVSKQSLIESSLMIPGSSIIKTTILFSLSALIFTFADLVLLTNFGIFMFISLVVSFFSSTFLFMSMLSKINLKST